MKILLIMDPGIAVPPQNYGGHERLVYMFAEEYIKLGHEVTLLAGPDSKISGQTVTFGVNNLQRSKFQKLKELFEVWKYLFSNRNNFDLIHNFGRLAYLIPILNSPEKKLMTYGRPVAKKGIRMATALPNKNLIFTACSDYCVSTGNVAGNWQTVYNAIDFSKYSLVEKIEESAPLIFLGRLDKIKGLHTAIEVAKMANHQLLVGGNIPNTTDNYQYYKEILEPQFDGKQIIYLGALNDEQKNHYLGKAKALLFPIEWDEPFGMVMVEAMACGTPVIGFGRGSVPEVIKDGENGFIVKSKEDMINALQKVNYINRSICRALASSKFDVSIITKNYLNL
ncbi:glycosyltransferase family 4 protein [Pedobacter sp.]|uniref:glycosyltransferase family 4 protein n=1 Tax=Pedobacter sp. TaxID=1411316 RepID=UPI0031E12D3B